MNSFFESISDKVSVNTIVTIAVTLLGTYGINKLLSNYSLNVNQKTQDEIEDIKIPELLLKNYNLEKQSELITVSKQMNDSLDILGIKKLLGESLTRAELKEAFKIKSKLVHPDKGHQTDGTVFIKVKEAYDNLNHYFNQSRELHSKFNDENLDEILTDKVFFVKKIDVPIYLLIDNFLRSKQFDPSRFSSFGKYMSEKNCLEGKHLDLSSLNLINIYERFIKIFMAHSHMFDVKSNPYVKKDKLDEFKYGLKKVSAIYAFLFVEQSITVMCTSHLEVKLIELSLLNFICTFLDSNTVKNSDLVALFKSLSFNTGSILSSDDEKINVKLLSTQPK